MEMKFLCDCFRHPIKLAVEKKLDNFFSVCAYTDHCGNLSFISHVISKYIATFCVVLYYFKNLEKRFSAGNFLIVVVNLITL